MNARLDALKVSVIIPVYNGAKFIAKAIDSVLAQHYPVHELIVINDGSKDETPRILEGYGSRIKAVHIPNGGGSNARNTGMSMATGDVIAFLDADDVWRADKLAVQMAALQAHPEVGFTCCNFLTLDGATGQVVPAFDRLKGPLGLNFEAPLKRSALAVLIEANMVGTCSNVVIRRSVLEQTGLFNTGYRQAEDYDLWLRCALVTGFLLQEACLLDKVTHDDNLTNNHAEMLLFHEQVVEQFWLQNQHHPLVAQQTARIKQALIDVRFDLGGALYNKGHKARAFDYFFKAFKTRPDFKNAMRYGWAVCKKLVRSLSGDRIKR